MAKSVEKPQKVAETKVDGKKSEKPSKPVKDVKDSKKASKDSKDDKKSKKDDKKDDKKDSKKESKKDDNKVVKEAKKDSKKDDKKVEAKKDVKKDDVKKDTKKDTKKEEKKKNANGRNFVDFDDGVEEEELKREIELLGGTTEDLELLYESTTSSETNGDAKMFGDLKAFMNQLGLDPSQVNPGFIVDDKEAEEEEEEEEEGDDEEDDEEEKPVKEDKKNEKLKEQLQKLISNPEIEEADLEKEEGSEEKGELDVAAKAKKIYIAPQTAWWELSTPEKSERKNRQSAIDEQTARAEELLKRQVKAFENKRQISKSEAEWIESVLKSGTLTDKVAALTLLVQENPLCRLHALESLVAMTKKKGKRECTAAVDSLKDLFLNDLLPGRKLLYFNERPLEKKNGDQIVLAWYFEDRLKTLYLEYISSLEALTHETMIFIKFKALTVIHDLLCGKAEQEKNLLALVVNKLGDTEKKLASKASYLLSQLLVQHPNMKMVVAKEVEQLLFRQNVSIKAQYYATIFLNQTILTQKESEVAGKLIDVYFSVYRLLVSKGEVETKMLSALLTGINRAFPFAKDSATSKFDEHADLLFKVVHQSSFNTAIQALALLYQISTVRQDISNRYYRALYEVLLDTRLLTSSKHTLFLNILFKGLRDDPSLARAKAFVKRILQICTYHQPHFVCGIFFMLSQVLKSRPGLDSLMSQPEDRDEHFEDVKDDEDEEPKEEEDSEKDSDEEEEDKSAKKPKKPSGIHAKITEYDPKKRDPQYCGAELACLWEIIPYIDHYHPSVGSFARSILKGESVTYNGNPLQDFTLIRFLDKFVYKNPKKEIKSKGTSIMQPMLSSRAKEVPMNVKNFGKLSNNVDLDEVFFQKFFSEKKRRIQAKPTKDKEEDPFAMGEMDEDYGDEDVDDLDDEENAGKKSKKDQKKKAAVEDEGEGEDDDEDSEDDDDIYKNLGNDDEEEDMDDEDFEANMNDEKVLEKLLLKDITDENFGDEDFDDDDDDEGEDLEDGGEDDEDDDDEDGLDLGDDDDDDMDDDDDDDDGFPFGGDDDDDEGSDDDEDEDEEDEEDGKKPGSKKRKRGEDEKIKFGGSTFASAEEFSHLLEGPAKSKNAGKQDKWDERSSAFDHRDKKRKLGNSRGGSTWGGPRGGSSRGGSRGRGGSSGGRGGGSGGSFRGRPSGGNRGGNRGGSRGGNRGGSRGGNRGGRGRGRN